MILYSIDGNKEDIPPRAPLIGVWNDFMKCVGDSLSEEELESTKGEKLFIDWAYETLGIIITIEDEKITQIEVSDENYTHLLLRYANNENII